MLALAIAAASAIVAVVVQGYRNATSDPVVRQVTFHMPDYPAGAEPITLVLLSDIHVHGPDMPPQRLASLVGRINALNADAIVIAGDFIGNNWLGGDYPIPQAIAPLAGLRARLGIYAVLGNNDHRAGPGAVSVALTAAHIRVLDNAAVEVGPLALGGLDDKADKRRVAFRKDLRTTFAAMRETQGARILLTHRPDVFPLVPSDVTLMLAGHTHCGQIVLPVIGPMFTGSRYGTRYICGVRRENGRTLLVTAGLGTSHFPIRWRAPPDIWLIRIVGSRSPSH